MTPPVPTPRFSCLCGESYMVAALDKATEASALDRHACPCQRPTVTAPIFEPDAFRAGPVVVIALGLLLAVAFVAAFVVDVIART